MLQNFDIAWGTSGQLHVTVAVPNMQQYCEQFISRFAALQFRSIQSLSYVIVCISSSEADRRMTHLRPAIEALVWERMPASAV